MQYFLFGIVVDVLVIKTKNAYFVYVTLQLETIKYWTLCLCQK